jgi:DNA-directed RNA polymerase subunit omega
VCETVESRFELVVLVAQRTRQIFSGAPLTIERDNDKYPVVALREIAERSIDTNGLREAVVKSYRRHIELDESEQEMADMLLEEQNLEGKSFDIGTDSFEEILQEESNKPGVEQELPADDEDEEEALDPMDEAEEEDA